jgi:hypothetical protein
VITLIHQYYEKGIDHDHENADTSDYKVIVQIWDKGLSGPAEGEYEPDTLVKEIRLDYPTAMTGEDVYLTSTRYIVVKEA